MNKAIQDQLDSQIEKKREAEADAVSDAPLLTPDAVAKDRRRTDIVEMNLKDQTAWVVESSDAPELTAEVLAEKGKPIQSVNLIFDGQVWRVHVRHGKPLRLQIKHEKRLADSKEKKVTPEMLRERDTAVKHLLLPEMIADPQFSYEGMGKGAPIEDCSRILLNALWEAYLAINAPLEDEIYQTTVLRGTPLHAAILLGESFELYPAPLEKKFADMSEDEIEAIEKRSLAQRRILVASMILSPAFSLNGEGKAGAYPIEEISEGMLQTLFQGYRVVNVPEAGRQALNRFSQVGNRDRSGQDKGD